MRITRPGIRILGCLAARAVTLMLLAQSAPPRPAFETATVKPSPPDGQCASMIEPMTGGGLRIACLPLNAILAWTYQVQNYQISGGPGWLTSAHWDILAKPAPPGPDDGPALEYEKMTDAQRARSSELVRQRLQSLLTERFQLVIRRETREQPAYALTVAKSGPRLKESADQSKSGFLGRGRSQITSRGSQLPLFAQYLAIDLRRPVVDRTGLTAHYDFHLEWTPETAGSASENRDPGASIFTAIQEQLGLRLESIKAPVDLLVIERAERPVEN